ncbi:hypothetical protein RCS94_01360 [Orbaceae bacterium ac157xtp]
MKIRAVILILFSFVLFSCKEERVVKFDQLQTRKDLRYLINEKEPFTGKAQERNKRMMIMEI